MDLLKYNRVEEEVIGICMGKWSRCVVIFNWLALEH